MYISTKSGVQPPAEGIHRAAAKSPVAPNSLAAGVFDDGFEDDGGGDYYDYYKRVF